MAKVSIIIPVYNVEKFIGKCTQSLLAQTLDDMEVFFVDDHCPDNSMEVARQCGRLATQGPVPLYSDSAQHGCRHGPATMPFLRPLASI